MSEFLETEGEDSYEGVTHAGILLVRLDGNPMVFLTQRALDETDDDDVKETWELPGGGREEGEDPLDTAIREFEEEVGFPLPRHRVVHGWRAGPEDNYQGFVAEMLAFPSAEGWQPTEEVQAIGWFTLEDLATMNLRPEVANTDLAELVSKAVSGNEETPMDELVAATQVGTADSYQQVDPDTGEVLGEVDVEPEFDASAFAGQPIPIHGVIAPEETESGDGRAFSAGSMTSRPLPWPFRFQKSDIGGHSGAVTVGSVDRVMRKDGLIHWDGLMMATEDASELVELIEFFGNRYGVSVDGDRGALDEERTDATGVTWVNAIRASGLTACAIPAFSEAFVALGPSPVMPTEEGEETETLVASGNLIGTQTFRRGPGWVTNPKETSQIHRYWTQKGQPGYAKIGWGTRGDFTRAKALIGEKIAKNSPEKMKYLNQIIAQWHHDALGYWPGDLDMPGNKTSAEAKAEKLEAGNDSIEMDTEGQGWETVLVSSATGARVKPPIEYFHRHKNTSALTIDEPDENGLIRTYGWAAQWGVCHVGMSGRCVEPPRTFSDDYPDFHLGRTKVEGGIVPTGVLTYGVGHRDAKLILSESADQAYFDNVNNAWAAVRIGEDETGIWFSGVVLPGMDPDHLTKIEASGQVSGEWLGNALRACLTVNVPGFPVQQASVEYDDSGNVLALAASAFGQATESPCTPTPQERMEALQQLDAEIRFATLKEAWAQ